MGDFWYGAAIVFVIALTIFTALSWGYGIKESAIEDTCAAYGKFTVDNNIYECKIIENKPK